jgi:hypothetical protein
MNEVRGRELINANVRVRETLQKKVAQLHMDRSAARAGHSPLLSLVPALILLPSDWPVLALGL